MLGVVLQVCQCVKRGPGLCTDKISFCKNITNTVVASSLNPPPPPFVHIILSNGIIVS